MTYVSIKKSDRNMKGDTYSPLLLYITLGREFQKQKSWGLKEVNRCRNTGECGRLPGEKNRKPGRAWGRETLEVPGRGVRHPRSGDKRVSCVSKTVLYGRKKGVFASRTHHIGILDFFSLYFCQFLFFRAVMFQSMGHTRVCLRALNECVLNHWIWGKHRVRFLDASGHSFVS